MQNHCSTRAGGPRLWKPSALWAGSIACALLSACAGYPVADEPWATSVRQVRTLQALHPQGLGPDVGPVPGDGVVAHHAVQRMHQSFETLPPPVNVLNIGVGTGARGAPAR